MKDSLDEIGLQTTFSKYNYYKCATELGSTSHPTQYRSFWGWLFTL